MELDILNKYQDAVARQISKTELWLSIGCDWERGLVVEGLVWWVKYQSQKGLHETSISSYLKITAHKTFMLTLQHCQAWSVGDPLIFRV